MCPITNPESIQIFMLLKFSVDKRTRFKTLVRQKKMKSGIHKDNHNSSFIPSFQVSKTTKVNPSSQIKV